MIVGLKRASLVVVTAGGRKKGAEITPQASQTKLQLPVDAHELDGKERRGMVLLFVSLGRNIKTMLSSTNLGVGFPYTVVGRHAVNVGGEGGVEREKKFQKLFRQGRSPARGSFWLECRPPPPPGLCLRVQGKTSLTF